MHLLLDALNINAHNAFMKFVIKYLITNKNFYKSELPFFQVFRGLHEFHFLKYYVNKATLLMFYFVFPQVNVPPESPKIG